MENPEKIRNPDFLREKYKLHTESEVTAAVLRTQQRTGKKLSIDTKENANDSIQNYLDRLENVFNPPQLEGHPDFDRQQRNLAMLKESLHDQFVIKPEQVPEAYFNAIKRKHREEGHGDIEIPQDYRLELAQNLIDDQVKSLDNWVDYLSSNNAKYPDWLKYFAFRNVARMGVYDKQKKSFGERTGGVTAPFPDLNREALAITLEAFERQAAGQPPKFGYDIQDDTKEKFNQFLKNKNFAKLYALAIEEFKPISEELLKITTGEWKTYPSGSNPKTLVESLAPYGTGWCIRGEGMAERYLVKDKNTLQVFYSLDLEGKATVPRIVTVVNANNQLTEVRGVAPEENLDEYIGPVVQEKFKEFPDGQLFEKKNQDMKTLTGIDNKFKQGQELNKDDLVFLYEINSTIEGFGYQSDPRIEELRKERNTKADMLIIFECSPEQIAHNASEINENIKAYVGKLEPGIFQKLPENLEHIYTSFPDKKIRKEDIAIGGQSADQLISAMEVDNIKRSGYAESMLKNPEFVPGKNVENITLIRLTVADLGFTKNATTDQIYQRAEELGLELCPPDTGPHYRLKYKNQPRGEWVYVGMKQISDSLGRPDVFFLHSSGARLLLSGFSARPADRWPSDGEFVFRFRKLES